MDCCRWHVTVIVCCQYSPSNTTNNKQYGKQCSHCFVPPPRPWHRFVTLMYCPQISIDDGGGRSSRRNQDSPMVQQKERIDISGPKHQRCALNVIVKRSVCWEKLKHVMRETKQTTTKDIDVHFCSGFTVHHGSQQVGRQSIDIGRDQRGKEKMD